MNAHSGMMSCDALIVGGGPAGSTLAWKLGEAGLNVVVLDKRTFPRDKTCAGWITPAVISTLELDTAQYAEGRVFQPIRRFITGVIGDTAVETCYPAPVSFGIRRFEFDDYLLRRSGARLVLGEPLTRLERDGDCWIVNESIHTPLIIGAGGHFCPVARRLGATGAGEERVVAAQEVEFAMTASQQRACRVSGDCPELYFCDDLQGYGWAVRKGDYLNIGLGRENPHGLPEQVAAFCARLKREDRVPGDMPTRFHGHAYLMYPMAPRLLVEDGVLLVGDAAGLADPHSGEGIRPAIESAMLAADTILAAQGDYRRMRLDAYVERLVTRFGKRQQHVPARSAPHRFRALFARALMRQPWFARHVVIDRWFLHGQQPPLPS